MSLHAEDFDYHFSLNNTQPYLKEGVILTLELNQTNHDVVLLFNFDLKKSKAYSFQRIGTQESDSHHNLNIQYRYLLYPLSNDKVILHFKLIKKVTTDASIAYSFSGDRDNVKGIVTKDFNITLPPLSLEVKPLPLETQIVGDFTLKHKLQKTDAQAYEPISFNMQIEGMGYPPLLEDILQDKGNFTLFKETPIRNSTLNKEETKSSILYHMALSHHKDFITPKIEINAFNPKTESSYLLSIPSYSFVIKKVAKKSLLDATDSPKPFQVDFSWFIALFGYLVVFVAGYLTAITLKWRRKQTRKTNNPLKQKIADIKEEKVLLQLLMATDTQYFSDEIEKLENSLYKNENIDLRTVKKAVMEKLK